MTDPLVSVIVPSYNHGEFVPQTIESILNQDYAHLEVVLVDDGSTDGTGRIVSGLFEDNPKFTYLHQENQGVGSARNLGINATSGEFIAVCDADDLWRSDKISTQIKFFSDPAVGLVFSDSQILIEGSLYPSDKLRHYEAGHYFYDLLVLNFMPCSSVMFRRSCLDKTGLFHPDRRMQGLADKHMWLRIAHDHKIVGSREPLVTLRGAVGNMSANLESMLEAEVYCLDDIKKLYPPQDPESRERYEEAYAKAYCHYARNYFYRGNQEQARNYFKICRRHWPLIFQHRIMLAATYAPIALVNFLRKLRRRVFGQD